MTSPSPLVGWRALALSCRPARAASRSAPTGRADRDLIGALPSTLSVLSAVPADGCATRPFREEGVALSTMPCLPVEVILGVDTHRDTHAVVLIDLLGRLVATATFPTT